MVAGEGIYFGIACDRVTFNTDASMTFKSRGYDTAKRKVKNPP
jgi:hypothetical protein